MKAALALLMMTVVLVVAEPTETEGEDFNGEFFQGMETGFFLRDTPQAYKDYDCPELNVDRSLTDMLNKFFVPIEMLLGLLKNEEISQTFKTVQVVINSVISLVATVDDYQGSEFCSGLFFGMHGSSMLLNVAKTFTMKIEQVIADMNDYEERASAGRQKYISAESKQRP